MWGGGYSFPVPQKRRHSWEQSSTMCFKTFRQVEGALIIQPRSDLKTFSFSHGCQASGFQKGRVGRAGSG